MKTTEKAKSTLLRLLSTVGRPVSAVSDYLCPDRTSPLLPEKAGRGLLSFIARIGFFFVTWGVVYLVMLANEPVSFTGDASGYWKLGMYFTDSNGVFDISNAPTGARGYFPSLIIWLCVRLGSDLFFIERVTHAYYAAFALMLAAVFVFAVPYLFRKIFRKKSGVPAAALFVCLMLFFWGGDMAHPLADLPSVCLSVLSAAAFMRLADGRFSLLSAFICGAAASAAYNCRQNYLMLLLILPLGAAVLILFARERFSVFGIRRGLAGKLCETVSRLRPSAAAALNISRKTAKLACLAAGVVVVMLPQAKINSRHYSIDSWQVPTQLYCASESFPDGYPLMLFNASNLMTMTKADFLVHDFREHKITASVYANVPYEGQQRVTDYRSYFNDIFTHPGWYLRSWASSAFLGMTASYDTIYITSLTDGFVLRTLTGYFILAVFLVTAAAAFIRFIRTKGRCGRLPHILLCAVPLAALFFSGLVCCLTKMETRYLLPWFLLVYGSVAFYCLPKLRLQRISPRGLCIFALKYLLPVLVVTAVLTALFIPFLKSNTLLFEALCAELPFLAGL